MLWDLLWLQDFRGLTRQRHFILKTDHMNLTYLNVTLTGKVQRWKLYLLDKDFYLCHVPVKEVHQFVPDALSRLCENHLLSNENETPAHKLHLAFLASIEPKHRISHTLLRYTILWLATGLAEVQRVPPRSHDHGPHYHPVHTPMPILPSYESTKNPH